MRIRVLLAACVAASAPSLGAQEIDRQCPPGAIGADNRPDNAMVSQDACQKAIDLFKYMAPQLGMVLAGGNPTQGFSGALGTKGRYSVGVRANAILGSLPEIDRVVPNTRGVQQSTYTLDTQPIGYAMADFALGLHEGSAETGFGAFDLLVSLSYLPQYSSGSVEVEPSSSFKLGFGGKLGIIRETAQSPGVSVSYLSRQLPGVTITGTSGSDSLLLADVRVKAKTWRLVAGKKMRFLGIGGGYGRDTYDSRGKITVSVAERSATSGGRGGPTDLGQKMSRRNVFGTVWVTSEVLRVVAELGRVSGGRIDTYNLFSGMQPADTRHYISLGLSFGR